MTLHCTGWEIQEEIKNNHRSQEGSEGSSLPATAEAPVLRGFPCCTIRADRPLYLELIQKAAECKFKEGQTYSQYNWSTRLRSPETWSGPDQTEIKSLKFTDEVVCITYSYYCRKLKCYISKKYISFFKSKTTQHPWHQALWICCFLMVCHFGNNHKHN